MRESKKKINKFTDMNESRESCILRKEKVFKNVMRKRERKLYKN
jgi:hypothetical protein